MLFFKEKLAEIDMMTWSERNVTGGENHLWLVRASDMLGDIREYAAGADELFILRSGIIHGQGIGIMEKQSCP